MTHATAAMLVGRRAGHDGGVSGALRHVLARPCGRLDTFQRMPPPRADITRKTAVQETTP